MNERFYEDNTTKEEFVADIVAAMEEFDNLPENTPCQVVTRKRLYIIEQIGMYEDWAEAAHEEYEHRHGAPFDYRNDFIGDPHSHVSRADADKSRNNIERRRAVRKWCRR